MRGTTVFRLYRRQLIFNYLEKYPNAPNRQVARALAKKYPEIWKDAEDARSHVRLYRGARGETDRKVIKIKKYFKTENLNKNE